MQPIACGIAGYRCTAAARCTTMAAQRDFPVGDGGRAGGRLPRAQGHVPAWRHRISGRRVLGAARLPPAGGRHLHAIRTGHSASAGPVHSWGRLEQRTHAPFGRAGELSAGTGNARQRGLRGREPGVPAPNEAAFPAQLQDARAAHSASSRPMRRSTASIRPATGVWGGSAGGHLAALAALTCGDTSLRPGAGPCGK